MRLFFALFLSLYIPGIAGAVATMPASPASPTTSTFTVSSREPGVKHGFIERIAEKILKKRLKKAMERSGDSDGKWLAISGLTLGLLGVLSFAFIFYTGFYLPLALGLAGLLLSIFGLIKASSWQDTRLIRILAVTGIVISALVVAPALGLIGA